MLEADQTSGTAPPQGSPALANLTLWGAVGGTSTNGQQEVRAVGSSVFRIRARITRPGSTSRTGGHATGRPHRVPLPTVLMYLCCPLLFSGSIWAAGADSLPVKVLGMHGWSLTRDHHAGMRADHSISRGSGRVGPLWRSPKCHSG